MTADFVLRGGDMFTAEVARRRASSVAIGGGRILAVGDDADMGPLTGASTQVIELAGRTVVPGFQDAHVHPGGGGLERLACDLSGVHSRAAYREVIGRYAREHPEEEWILGGGWSMDLFPGGTPSREELDAVESRRPVMLSNRDHHAVWVNSRALELAGIGAATPDPPHGRIEREAGGGPLGTLQEAAARLVGSLVPSPTLAKQREALVVAQRYLHSLGITSWQDAIIGTYDSIPDMFGAYLSLLAAGELTAKVVGALWWDRDAGIEQIDALVSRRDQAGTGRFRATSVKMMLDGVCETCTASLSEPYLSASGEPSDQRGMDFIDPLLLREYVTALDAHGFQVHFHAIGDKAVRSALDAVAAARSANGFSDNRHHIAHLQVVDPADLPRFRQLGVVANLQALWACNDPQMTELTVPILGERRASWQYPFGGLVRAGAALAFGSDWPVSSPDPLQALHVAVNRTIPPGEGSGAGVGAGGADEPLLPAERLDLATALAGYTAGSAWVNQLEGETGTIEVGKLADLAVLDRDLFALPSSEISSARVVATFAEGSLVHESGL
jgi:predicted amidohydrolase YtcJ